MKPVDRLFDEVVASRPAGHFDATKALPLRYCELAVEGRRQCAKLSAIGLDDPRADEILTRNLELTTEMCDLATRDRFVEGYRKAGLPE
jgi:hypothetical protein